MDPEVLVLDEPTAGLDSQATLSLCAIFHQLRKEGRTLVLISHDMDLVAQLATHTAVLQEGRIHLQGPTRTVLSDPDFDRTSGLEPPAPMFPNPPACGPLSPWVPQPPENRNREVTSGTEAPRYQEHKRIASSEAS